MKINYQKLNRSIIGLMIFSGLLCMPYLTKAAATAKQLYVKPSQIEIKAQPGQKIRDKFTVYNDSEVKVRMKLVVKNFTVTNNNGQNNIALAEGTTTDQWVVPQYKEFALNPHTHKEVSFIAVIPDTATSSGHYEAIMFEKTDDKTAGPEKSFGELILITVTANPGDVTAMGQITNFKTDLWQMQSPLTLDLKVKNYGNTHLDSTAVITVDNWRNQQVAKISTGKKVIFPNLEQAFHWQWKNDLPAGFYRMKIELKNLSNQQNNLVNQTWFIVMPMKYMVLASTLLLLFIAGLVIYFIRVFPYRRYIKI